MWYPDACCTADPSSSKWKRSDRFRIIWLLPTVVGTKAGLLFFSNSIHTALTVVTIQSGLYTRPTRVWECNGVTKLTADSRMTNELSRRWGRGASSILAGTIFGTASHIYFCFGKMEANPGAFFVTVLFCLTRNVNVVWGSNESRNVKLKSWQKTKQKRLETVWIIKPFQLQALAYQQQMSFLEKKRLKIKYQIRSYLKKFHK